MAEFNLARIRYTWKNVWLPGATYIKDDIARWAKVAKDRNIEIE